MTHAMLRKAVIDDIIDIHKLVYVFAKESLMLDRSINEISEHIRDFVVFEKDGNIVGCSALQSYMQGLAEVKSLAVRKDCQGQGIGSELVRFNLEEARDLRFSKIFVLTYAIGFFEKLGFNRTDKESLPQKIWQECVKCVKFPECDETALIKEIKR